MRDPLDSDLDLLYAGPELADEVAAPCGTFGGFLDLADASVLDGRAQAGDAQLIYPSQVTLAANDEIVVRGQRYRVVADPERFGDGRESVAQLRAV